MYNNNFWSKYRESNLNSLTSRKPNTHNIQLAASQSSLQQTKTYILLTLDN